MVRVTKPLPKWSASRTATREFACCNRKTAGKRARCSAAWPRPRHGIVVFIDADTHCQRDTLPRLLEPFADRRASAPFPVTPKSAICARFIARCQALEYTCGFNLDRRAYNRWNCITVVPGAISAIRKDAIDEAGGLSLRDARRRHRSHALVAQTSATHCLCAGRDRLDRSAGDGAHSRAATIPLGLRHAAMSVETSRHGLQLELSRARLVQFAERLVFPDHPRRHHADGRFVPARFAAIRRLGAVLPFVIMFLAMDVHPGDARLHFGTRTNPARLADSTDAPDLPADAQLLHLESNPARDQRRMGQLGQTRAHCQRACACMILGRRSSCKVFAARVPLT